MQYSSGPKGSGTCSEGEVIMEKAECKDACRKLGVTLANTEVRIVGGYACYSDSHGHCFQNGKNGTGASMICKVSEDKESKFLTHFYKSVSISMNGNKLAIHSQRLRLYFCSNFRFTRCYTDARYYITHWRSLEFNE